MPPVDAAAVDVVCVPDTAIVAVSVSPECSVAAVQHAHDVVCYSTEALAEQRKTEPLWTWQLQGGADVRQACHLPPQHVPCSLDISVDNTTALIIGSSAHSWG